MMVLNASIHHTTAFECPAAVPQTSLRSSFREDRTPEGRKLGLLKRAGLFGNDLKGCMIQRACTAEDLRAAYTLVHDIYLGSGLIGPDPSGMRLRIFESSPETATFVAKVDGKVVGVISVVEDSKDLGLPSDAVFPVELGELRRAGRRLCEYTNQVVSEEYRKSAVPTELMRSAAAISLTQGYHEAIAAVSPSHNGFYELLGFRQIGSQRSYSQTIDDPVIAVSMDIDQYRESEETGLSSAAKFIREFLMVGNHFVSQMVEWGNEARRHFLDPDLLKQLFAPDERFLSKCSPLELGILQRRWGDAVFSAVTGPTNDAAPEAQCEELVIRPTLPRLNSSNHYKNAAHCTRRAGRLPYYQIRHYRRMNVRSKA